MKHKKSVGIASGILVMMLLLASCVLSVGNGANGGNGFGTAWFAPLQGVGRLIASGQVGACGVPNGYDYTCQQNWMRANVTATGFVSDVWNKGSQLKPTADYLAWMAFNTPNCSVNVKDSCPCILLEESNWDGSFYISVIWPGDARCRFNDYA